MKKISINGFILSLLFSLSIYGQNSDSIVNKLTQFVQSANFFSQYIPQEKVYLHFDNNSYYKGDNIWFKCYVVTSKLHETNPLSNTLYVDLLNPGGEVIAKRTLEIKDGQCHGDFILTNPVFYSGFYEVRAYTKYMLNFGEEAIFSRVFPVFDMPKNEGNFTERIMDKDTRKYAKKRKNPSKKKKVNITFFPEGGNLVNGVESRIAFQATDEYGNPIDVSGEVIDDNKNILTNFVTTYEGRGAFYYTPSSKKTKAVIRYDEKEHKIDLPEAESRGYVMRVDNLSNSENIDIYIDKNGLTPPDILGAVTLSRGEVYSFNILDFNLEDNLHLNIPKQNLPAGVNQIIVFDQSGAPLCDRLIFIDQENFLNITETQNKESYSPHELVNLEFSVTDKEDNPVNTSFSLSVKDAANDDIFYSDNIATNLLLSSEIKGYIQNPSYYFETNDTEHKEALDLLLMVQGWRRYVWKQMVGIEPIDLKHLPEKGVEIKGSIRSPMRKKIKPNMDITLALSKTDEDGNKLSEYLIGKSDSLGQFKIISNLHGTWDMVLGVSEKGKKKKENIILDRLFRPEARTYKIPELQIKTVEKADNNNKQNNDNNESITDPDIMLSYVDDSLSLGMDKKVHHLKDVTVTAKSKKNEYLKKPTAYYDVQSEINNVLDDGGFVDEDIYDFLVSMDPRFTREVLRGEYIYYFKNKRFVIIKDSYHYNYYTQNNTLSENYIGPSWEDPYYAAVEDKRNEGYIDIASITRLSAVKSIYINEDPGLVARMFPGSNRHDIDRTYGAVVFLDMHPDAKIPNGSKAVRKLKLEGYSLQREFNGPDYSVLPKEPDYRRTLYWNPNVTTDKEGKAYVQFYNNSSCKNINISAETITPKGITGVYKPE